MSLRSLGICIKLVLLFIVLIFGKTNGALAADPAQELPASPTAEASPNSDAVESPTATVQEKTNSKTGDDEVIVVKKSPKAKRVHLEPSREEHPFGVELALLTEPFPSLWGINLSYNIIQWVRVTVGYGSFSATDALSNYKATFTTIDANVKGFLAPWTFAPFLSLGYTHVSATITGVGTGVGGLTGAGSSPFYGFGFDWQTHGGFNLGFEYQLTSIDHTAIGLPGFYLGWFF